MWESEWLRMREPEPAATRWLMMRAVTPTLSPPREVAQTEWQGWVLLEMVELGVVC